MAFALRSFGIHRTVSGNFVAQVAHRNAEVHCVCIRHDAHDLPRRVGPGSDCWNKVCAEKPSTGVGIFGAANVSRCVSRDCDSSFGLAHSRISHSKFVDLLWSSRSAEREPRSQWHFDMVAKSSAATGHVGGDRTFCVVPGSCAFGFNPTGHDLDGFKFSLSAEGSSARHPHNRQASRRAAGCQHSRLYGGSLPDWFDFAKRIRDGRNSEDRDRPGVHLRGVVAAQHF